MEKNERQQLKNATPNSKTGKKYTVVSLVGDQTRVAAVKAPTPSH